MIKPWVRAALGMFAVGWGANQFASLLLAYRDHAGVSAGVADGLFGFYALGLIPTLMVAGPLSDRHGRRTLARPAMLLTSLATVVLMLGAHSVALLFVGRFLAGIASGAIFAPGTAWVKELSDPPYAAAADLGLPGARRAAVALSAGFATGPLVAGLIAQYAPHPLVLPYFAHLIIVAIAAPIVWGGPETVPAGSDPPGNLGQRMRVRSIAAPRFRRDVIPLTPWVFTSASISVTIGPALVAHATGSFAIAFAGIIAGLTLGTGVLIQPLARRLHAANGTAGATAGLLAAAGGCGCEAITASTDQPIWAILAALLLGSGYGFCLVTGLSQTQQIADPHELAGLTAVYYALIYLGFAAPVGLALLSHLASYEALLGAVGLLALLTWVGLLITGHRDSA